LFQYVYIPVTQPNHPEFPVDWTTGIPDHRLWRAVFIASRDELRNDLLSTSLLDHQRYHE
jgi:hypothetical protein